MKSIWLPYDDSLDQYSRQEVTNLMRTFLYIIPGIAVTLATIDFIFGYTSIALTTLSVPLFFWTSMYFLNRGKINTAMIIITSIMIIATTAICFIGAGIHEVGVVIFPVIVFFSSLVMNIRGVIVTTSIVIIALGLIVLEEYINIFPKEAPVSGWVDLIVALSVLIIHSFMTFSFSSITRDNLSRIRKELRNQERYKIEIQENLHEKTELLRLVHHRVKNNLLLINSLIELEAYGNPEIKEEFSEITQSVHTIARAHDPLYHTEDYKQVEIKPYLEKLITTFAQSNVIKELETKIDECLIFHESALLLGIVLQKLLSSIQQIESMHIKINLESKKDQLRLEVRAKGEEKLLINKASIVDLLIKEANGELALTSDRIELTIPTKKGELS